MAEIVLVQGDDWEGLYVNEDLKVEGHRITATDIMEMMAMDFDIKHADQYLIEHGQLPQWIGDLEFDDE